MTEKTEKELVAPAREEAKNSRARRRIVAAMAAIIAGVLVLGGLLFSMHYQMIDLKSQSRENNATARKNAEAAQALAAQVKKLGGVPTVSPPVPGGPASTISDDVHTRSIVEGEVATYVRQHPPAKGKDGKSAPPVDQTALVNRILALIPTPKDGTNGSPAPPVTTAQLTAVVAAYCQSGACTGPTGPKGDQGGKGDVGDSGPKGDPGSNAPQPSGFDLTDDGTGCRLTLTYDNGRSFTAEFQRSACTSAQPEVATTAPESTEGK